MGFPGEQAGSICLVGNHGATHLELVRKRADSLRDGTDCAIIVESEPFQFPCRQQELPGDIVTELLYLVLRTVSADPGMTEQQMHRFVQ